MSPEIPEPFKSPQKRTEFFELVDKRNQSIPNLIVEDRVLQERREQRTAFLMMLGDLWFIRRKSTFFGQNHLEEALKLIEQGEPFTVISNHFSDSDSAIRRFMLEYNGYREFADSLLYLGGLRMLERPLVRQVASAEKFVVVPTPLDMENVKHGLTKEPLTPQERSELQEIKRRLR